MRFAIPWFRFAQTIGLFYGVFTVLIKGVVERTKRKVPSGTDEAQCAKSQGAKTSILG